MRVRALAALSLLSSLALAACGSPERGAAGLVPGAYGVASAPSPIKHVIVMIQENRSYDNFFATYPGADGATSGLCRANGRTYKIPLHKVSLVGHPIDGHILAEPNYDWGNFETEYDGGKMDGFCRDPWGFQNHPLVDPSLAYEYVDPAELRPLWNIAQQYVLADRMFETQGSGSFVAHQVLIRGNTDLNANESIVGNPSGDVWGCGAPPGTHTTILTSKGTYRTGPYPCFTWPTLRDLLDAKHVSWKYYVPQTGLTGSVGNIWNAFYAIRQVYHGPEWTTNVTNAAPYEMQIFNDLKNGQLPAVSWVIPDAYNSDHPGNSSDTGPSWVAQVVNAVGASPYWNSTAIVVVWDDWGGWYDHVPPPQLDYKGLAFRVPCLIVSPYARKGLVDRTPYEFGSILKYIEGTFGLGSLGTTDVRATSILNAFDYTQPARAFAPIPAKYSKRQLMSRPESRLPVDND